MIRWLTQESAHGTSGPNIEAATIIAMQNAALQVHSVVQRPSRVRRYVAARAGCRSP
jgi:hypothetical protein